MRKSAVAAAEYSHAFEAGVALADKCRFFRSLESRLNNTFAYGFRVFESDQMVDAFSTHLNERGANLQVWLFDCLLWYESVLACGTPLGNERRHAH
jgi:hypothetical protein